MIHDLVVPALAAAALAATPASGPRLDVKPGLWEMKSTTSTKMEGDLPTPDLSKLSPEMRARVQAARERMASGKPHTTVRRSCVTQDQLDKERWFDDRGENGGCERRYLDRSPKHVRVALSCAPKSGASVAGEYEVTVKNPGLVAIHGNVKTHTPGRDSASTTEITASRLGESCGDLKPGESKTVAR